MFTLIFFLQSVYIFKRQMWDRWRLRRCLLCSGHPSCSPNATVFLNSRWITGSPVQKRKAEKGNFNAVPSQFRPWSSWVSGSSWNVFLQTRRCICPAGSDDSNVTWFGSQINMLTGMGLGKYYASMCVQVQQLIKEDIHCRVALLHVVLQHAVYKISHV